MNLIHCQFDELSYFLDKKVKKNGINVFFFTFFADFLGCGGEANIVTAQFVEL